MALMREGLRHGSETNFPLAVAVGHEMYYPCSGFERADVYGVVAPFEVPPSAWMGHSLPAYRSEARGCVAYPEPLSSVM